MFEYPDNIDYSFTLTAPLEGDEYITVSKFGTVHVPTTDSEDS